MNRKKFLQQAVLTSGSVLTVPVSAFSQTNSLDPLPAEKVKDFVIAGHGNIDKVKSMLGEIPTLLYSTWDWGNGDFETPLRGQVTSVTKRSPIT